MDIIIETAAVVAFAIYGVLRGLRKGFDAVGLTSVAFAVAFGGGTLRDLLIDRRPLFWVANEHYVWIVVGVAFAGATFPRQLFRFERYLAIPDALGLGLFSIVGTKFAIDAGMSPVLAVLLGVITGTFGGVIGDLIYNETPSLFRQSPLYATCSLAGASFYLAFHATGVPDWLAQSAGVSITFALRMLALRYSLCLPTRGRGDATNSPI